MIKDSITAGIITIVFVIVGALMGKGAEITGLQVPTFYFVVLVVIKLDRSP